MKFDLSPKKGECTVDLATFLDTRALFQANSGGGKSQLIRLIAELAIPHVPVIILDPEGEFVTLRESVDILIAGREGELPVAPKTAGVLAHKLVETGISCVVDLYDLTIPNRREFVRIFIDSLMALPRSMWRPLLILIDEAHIFCPERSAGESVATQSVINLVSQGRKRGFGTVLATQRFAKLHKDAVAELLNVFIGRTNLPNDLERCAYVLGIPRNEALALRKFKPGEFRAFGPAIEGEDIVEFRGAKPKSRHPEPGNRHKIKAKPTQQSLAAVCLELKNAMQSPDTTLYDMDDAKRRIGELERQLRAKPAAALVDTKPLDDEIKRLRGELKAAHKGIETMRRKLEAFHRAAKAVVDAHELKDEISIAPPDFSGIAPPAARPIEPFVKKGSPGRFELCKERPARAPGDGEAKIGACEHKILAALAMFPHGCDKRKVAIFSGYSVTSGGFAGALAKLRELQFIDGNGKCMTITDAGLDKIGPVEPLPGGKDLLEFWKNKLELAAANILQALWDHGAPDKGQLASATNYSKTSGGFAGALATLRGLGLIGTGNPIRLADTFNE